MVLGDLGLNNALGGMMAMREAQTRQSLGGLQGVLGVLQAARQQEEMRQQAELAPLRMKVMESQVANVQRQADEAKAREVAINQLPEQVRPYARIAGPQFVAGQFKNPNEVQRILRG